MKVMNRIRTLAAGAVGLGALSAASAWAADLKVGFITSLSGPVSSLGIPYDKGMKAAVAYLEPHMEKADSASKGTIVLATVKCDVHDIGKNLVDIILSNNGYRIVNLGIKVPPEDLIKAHRQHQPDAIGLSGLLVKSAQMMVVQSLSA